MSTEIPKASGGDAEGYGEFIYNAADDDAVRQHYATEAGWMGHELDEIEAKSKLYDPHGASKENLEECLRVISAQIEAHGIGTLDLTDDEYGELLKQRQEYTVLLLAEETYEVETPPVPPLDPRGVLGEAVRLAMKAEQHPRQVNPEIEALSLPALMQRNYMHGLTDEEYAQATTLIFAAPESKHVCIGCKVNGNGGPVSLNHSSNRAIEGLPYCKGHTRFELTYRPVSKKKRKSSANEHRFDNPEWPKVA